MRIEAFLRGVLAAGLLAAAGLAHAAANIVIVNANGPGVGFNDPAPAAPVGGNPGTTLGQQRLNAFQHAASVWGRNIVSSVEIRVLAVFQPLACTATSAVLGAAGTRFIFANFPNAPVAETWYSNALANKLAGVDLLPAAADPAGAGADIVAFFNSRLGLFDDCLPGSPFYLGLDGNHGAAIDLVAVLLHEFGHGLGFQTFTNGTTGAFIANRPSIYDHFAFDNASEKTWAQMTPAERVASAVNGRGLVWIGANVFAAVPQVLLPGTPRLQVTAPPEVKGDYLAGGATFGPPLDKPGLNRQVMPVVELDAQGQPALGLACAPLDAANARAVKNRIAMVLRGVCTAPVKVLNAQNAGAAGVIVVENIETTPPNELGGEDPAITIPAVRITQADGRRLLQAMQLTPSNRSSGVVARLGADMTQLAGADRDGRPMLYTPNPFQGGSSVSHWDTSANRNLLMEPFINADLTQSVSPPQDLTLPLFRDIGW